MYFGVRTSTANYYDSVSNTAWLGTSPRVTFGKGMYDLAKKTFSNFPVLLNDVKFWISTGWPDLTMLSRSPWQNNYRIILTKIAQAQTQSFMGVDYELTSENLTYVPLKNTIGTIPTFIAVLKGEYHLNIG